MRQFKTTEQVKHYLLSFDDYTLIYWYNNVIISPFQDYSEQAIRDNNENNFYDLAEVLSPEEFIKVIRDKRTTYFEEDRHFCLTGCDNPYIISFSKFEEFLKLTEGAELCKYLLEQNDDLEALESVSQDIENRRNGK